VAEVDGDGGTAAARTAGAGEYVAQAQAVHDSPMAMRLVLATTGLNSALEFSSGGNKL
jgi:hypothetical protein